MHQTNSVILYSNVWRGDDLSRRLMGLERGAIGRREGEHDGWRKERKRTYEEVVVDIQLGCRGISEAGMKDGKRYRRRRIVKGEGSFGLYI